MAFIPNSLLSSNSVVNYSHENTRRVDWTIGIEYNEDVDRARNLLRSIIESDSRILKTPDYTIALLSLGASSVNIVIPCLDGKRELLGRLLRYQRAYL